MTVIPFPRETERAARGSPPPDGHSAAIMFFTGVRFERHTEMPQAASKPVAKVAEITPPSKPRRVPTRRPRKA